MAAHYKTVSCLSSPKGSVAATQHPNKEIRNPQQKGAPEMTKEIVPKTRRRKENRTPVAPLPPDKRKTKRTQCQEPVGPGSSSSSSILKTPAEVVRKKSSTAGLHPSSANRSPTRHFRFPLYVSSLALAQSLACWSFHREQCLKRWSLVCGVPLMLSGSHRQQWSSGRLSVLFRYTPVRACPELSWQYREAVLFSPLLGSGQVCPSSGARNLCSGFSARTMIVLPATSFPSPCAVGAPGTPLAASPVFRRRASAIPPRGRPVRLRPAWPICPRPRSRGSPCGPGTSVSRSRYCMIWVLTHVLEYYILYGLFICQK